MRPALGLGTGLGFHQSRRRVSYVTTAGHTTRQLPEPRLAESLPVPTIVSDSRSIDPPHWHRTPRQRERERERLDSRLPLYHRTSTGYIPTSHTGTTGEMARYPPARSDTERRFWAERNCRINSVSLLKPQGPCAQRAAWASVWSKTKFRCP